VCYPAVAVRRSFRSTVFAFVIAAASASGPAARAAGSNKSDALVNQAVELRRDGDDQGALALLLQAYGAGRAPRATGQLGLCEQALGRWADAEVYITEALKAESDPWVKKSRRALEDALVIVKSHIARVEIEGEPPGAEIWVNGTLAGKLPLASPVRVSAGEVEVELRAPGFVREAKTMHLEAGQYQRIVLRAMKEVAPTPPPPAAAPAPQGASTTTVVVNLDDKRRDQAPSAGLTTPATPAATASAGRLSLKWVAFGLGAAALGVGIYGTAANASGVTTFDKDGCRLLGNGNPVNSTGMTSLTCTNDKADYDAKAKLGIEGFVAGGVLVATGLVLWLTEPAAHASETASLSCLPALTTRGELGVGCGLRF
jgi:PEGA domain